MALAALLAAVAAPAATTVRPWGDNAIRVQFCAGACSDTLSGALGAAPPATAADDAAKAQQQALGRRPVVSGNLKAALDGKGLLSPEDVRSSAFQSVSCFLRSAVECFMHFEEGSRVI